MRSGSPITKRGTAILDEPRPEYGSATDRPNAPKRAPSRASANLRHDFSDDFAGDYNEARPQGERRLRPRSIKLKLRTRIPTSVAGRIATGVALLLIAGVGVALLMLMRSFLLHDSRFMIHSRAAVEIQGNRHLTQGKLLDLFREDIGRNIFRISLADRQAELEALPWVERATVMRLLPGRIRIAIAERTPVAFVRQGSHIGLVDGSGVLLDMAPSGTAAQTEPHYSFPVVTGVSSADPASTRAARMKIFERFTADLDSSGEKISEVLSEVDLSNPEDVKALIPANSSEILVHFGDDHFLERYRRFQQLLPAWHTAYPKLASVDMRYEREVVLDMEGSAAAKIDAAPAAIKPAHLPVKPAVAASHTIAANHAALLHPAPKPAAKPAPHLVAASAPYKLPSSAAKPAVPTPASPPAAKTTPPAMSHPVASTPSAASHSAASATPPAALSPSAAARSGYPVKPAAGKPVLPTDAYHPPQVPTK